MLTTNQVEQILDDPEIPARVLTEEAYEEYLAERWADEREYEENRALMQEELAAEPIGYRPVWSVPELLVIAGRLFRENADLAAPLCMASVFRSNTLSFQFDPANDASVPALVAWAGRFGAVLRAGRLQSGGGLRRALQVEIRFEFSGSPIEMYVHIPDEPTATSPNPGEAGQPVPSGS